jgi:DNA repair photolyase
MKGKRSTTGRAAPFAVPNRFESNVTVPDLEHLEFAEDDSPGRVPTLFLPDRAKTLIRENNSPDIPFRFSINPYRGCEHGCAYCYARPTHETLGMNAALDFESKVLVKQDAAKLLRKALNEPSWGGETIALSGVTDCYQPIERKLQITRGLLQVLLEAEQAVMIVTKNALVLRDLDLLRPLAERGLVQVGLSVTSLDGGLSRSLEPRTSSPPARLRAVRGLRSAGVPVSVMVSPVIAGLNDHEIASILQAASQAGAMSAQYTLLRLPLAVAPIFLAWLDEHRPAARARIESLIRSTRSGQLNDPCFGSRMRGEASYAANIRSAFKVFARKFNLHKPLPPLDTSRFRPPRGTDGQGRLF